jgi:hypothetical protein
MSSKTDTSSLKHPRGLQTRKGENDRGQNRSIKTTGCKIAQLAKYRGESAIKPITKYKRYSNRTP